MSLIPITPGALNSHDVESTLGVLYAGYIATMVLFGFTFFHGYVYFARYHSDPWFLRVVVSLFCFMDTVSAVLISQSLYYYMVTLFPFTETVQYATKAYRADNGVTVLLIYLIQLFYSWRVWTLCKNVIVPGIIACLATGSFVFGIIMTIQMANNPAFVHLAEPGVKSIAAVYEGVTGLTGLAALIAISFYMQPSQTPGIKPLPGWFDYMVAYCVSRGGLATALQFTYFFVFLALPTEMYWLPMHLLVSRIYVLSVLTLLNSRAQHNGHGVNEEDTVASLSVSGLSSYRNNPNTVRFNVTDSKQAPINIEVSRTVEHDAPSKGVYDDEDSQNSINDISAKKAQLGP